jgi:murein tripeptide amidase MpaA
LSENNAEIANVRFIGGLHGNEKATTEVLIQMIEFLLSHYGKDTFITQLIDTTRIYFAPMVNPDASELSEIGKCDSTKGLTNANDVDLDQSFFDGIICF